MLDSDSINLRSVIDNLGHSLYSFLIIAYPGPFVKARMSFFTKHTRYVLNDIPVLRSLTSVEIPGLDAATNLIICAIASLSPFLNG